MIGYYAHGLKDSAVGVSSASLPAGFDKVLSTYATIESSYYKSTSSKKLANGAIKGMVNSLGDQFSTYLTNDSKSSLDSTLSASFGGIGATVQQGDNKLTIEGVMANTPAKKAGMKTGDVLIAVNGKNVAKDDVNTAVEKIRGKIGTTVKVTVKHDGKTMTSSMKLAKITTDTVEVASS